MSKDESFKQFLICWVVCFFTLHISSIIGNAVINQNLVGGLLGPLINTLIKFVFSVGLGLIVGLCMFFPEKGLWYYLGRVNDKEKIASILATLYIIDSFWSTISPWIIYSQDFPREVNNIFRTFGLL